MAVKHYETLTAAFKARYPNATQAGTVDSISASGGSVPTIEAAAVRGFASVSGKLLWIKANSHFYEAGELIVKDDLLQLEEATAKSHVAAGRADPATDDEVKAAQAAAAKGKA